MTERDESFIEVKTITLVLENQASRIDLFSSIINLTVHELVGRCRTTSSGEFI